MKNDKSSGLLYIQLEDGYKYFIMEYHQQLYKMAICLLFSQLVVAVGKVVLCRHIYSLFVLSSCQIR